ncbi:GIY-YIG nuclease family protein [Desulfobulbus sp. F5]|nr:GIY-YIG nuclease family protein [Desulfobulbus sp. F5]
MLGKTIKIFLVDGSPSGIRIAELGLSTIKAMVIPRASLMNASERTEPNKTGVYILIGSDSDNIGVKKIYIGEGDAILDRLKAHDKDETKDFWEEVVLFVSKDDNLTKSHARYLESRLISLARDAKRVTIVNSTSPPEAGKIPEADAAEMEQFIFQARLLLGTLGYDLFNSSTINGSDSINLNKNNQPLQNGCQEFSYSGDGFDAKCLIDTNSGKFIVREKSIARENETRTLPQATKMLRKQLTENGVMKRTGDGKSYIFSQDYVFNSISSAAQVISGSSVNGRAAWKLDGKTYADWQESKLELKSTPIDNHQVDVSS